MDISYRRFTLEVHISWFSACYVDENTTVQFSETIPIWMVLVKCQHEHYSDLQSLEVINKRYHISHNFPEQ
jgi:hypothetical protein